MNVPGISGFTGAAQATPKNQTGQNLPDAAVDAEFTEVSSSANTGGASGSLAASPTNNTDDAATKFMNYMKETPAQRMQEAWLAQHGITKAQFDAMTPAQQKGILAQIKQEIEQKAKEAANHASRGPVNILA